MVVVLYCAVTKQKKKRRKNERTKKREIKQKRRNKEKENLVGAWADRNDEFCEFRKNVL